MLRAEQRDIWGQTNAGRLAILLAIQSWGNTCIFSRISEREMIVCDTRAAANGQTDKLHFTQPPARHRDMYSGCIKDSPTARQTWRLQMWCEYGINWVIVVDILFNCETLKLPWLTSQDSQACTALTNIFCWCSSCYEKIWNTESSKKFIHDSAKHERRKAEKCTSPPL